MEEKTVWQDALNGRSKCHAAKRIIGTQRKNGREALYLARDARLAPGKVFTLARDARLAPGKLFTLA